MTLYFAPQAEADFAALIGYLADRNAIAARELSERIFAIIDKLARNEFEGPEQTLVSGEVVRSWPIPPLRVYYQRQPSVFWVVRIEDRRFDAAFGAPNAAWAGQGPERLTEGVQGV